MASDPREETAAFVTVSGLMTASMIKSIPTDGASLRIACGCLFAMVHEAHVGHH